MVSQINMIYFPQLFIEYNVLLDIHCQIFCFYVLIFLSNLYMSLLNFLSIPSGFFFRRCMIEISGMGESHTYIETKLNFSCWDNKNYEIF